MGVMGAFIFAAQMINFPVGNGTSGHLVGGALLSFTLGPAAASIVMTAILATQALVFQDGGVARAREPMYSTWRSRECWRVICLMLCCADEDPACFWAGCFRCWSSAGLALAELIAFGRSHAAGRAWRFRSALFRVSAIIEGAITLAVVQALERIQPGFLRRPQGTAGPGRRGFLPRRRRRSRELGVFVASTQPDGIERLALDTACGAQPDFSVRRWPITCRSSPFLTRRAAGWCRRFVC